MTYELVDQYLDQFSIDMKALDTKLADSRSYAKFLEADIERRLFESVTMYRIESGLISSRPSDEATKLRRLFDDANAFKVKIMDKQKSIEILTVQNNQLTASLVQSESEKVKLKECLNRLSQQLAQIKSLSRSDLQAPFGSIACSEPIECDFVTSDLVNIGLPEPKNLERIPENLIEAWTKTPGEFPRYERKLSRLQKPLITTQYPLVRNYNNKND